MNERGELMSDNSRFIRKNISEAKGSRDRSESAQSYNTSVSRSSFDFAARPRQRDEVVLHFLAPINEARKR